MSAPAVSKVAAPGSTEEKLEITPELRQHAGILLQAAVSGSTPEAVAGFITGNLDEAGAESLLAFLDNPACTSFFLAAEPKLHQYQGWLVQLFNILKDALTGDDGEEGEIIPSEETPPAAVPVPGVMGLPEIQGRPTPGPISPALNGDTVALAAVPPGSNGEGKLEAVRG